MHDRNEVHFRTVDLIGIAEHCRNRIPVAIKHSQGGRATVWFSDGSCIETEPVTLDGSREGSRYSTAYYVGTPLAPVPESAEVPDVLYGVQRRWPNEYANVVDMAPMTEAEKIQATNDVLDEEIEKDKQAALDAIHRRSAEDDRNNGYFFAPTP